MSYGYTATGLSVIGTLNSGPVDDNFYVQIFSCKDVLAMFKAVENFPYQFSLTG